MSGTRSAGIALLVAIVACTENDTIPRDTDDLGYEGSYGIETIDRSCTAGASDTWRVAVRTEGWASAVELRIFAAGTTGPVETHPLVNVDYDPGGEWDEWEITLLQAAEDAAAQVGATTLWGCDDAPNLAWQLVMYPADDSEVPADCAVWGAQASSALAGPADVACECVDDDGDCS